MGTPGGFKLRHFVLGAILLIVGIWIAAHAILVALAAGDLTGYVLGFRCRGVPNLGGTFAGAGRAVPGRLPSGA